MPQVVGSGGVVGKPSSGWNGREVAVIFADRPAGSARWEIRVGHAPFGKLPASTEVIPLPEGGPGGDAFAPDIAGLADGRWVLIWTEGPPGSRAMRAQTLGSDFKPVGDPIALSPPAGNFGQGILGVAESYVGAVFLSRPAASYELWGVILNAADGSARRRACPPRCCRRSRPLRRPGIVCRRSGQSITGNEPRRLLPGGADRARGGAQGRGDAASARGRDEDARSRRGERG
jgi:hypothetical protein